MYKNNNKIKKKKKKETFGILYLAKSAEVGFPQKMFLSNPTVPAFRAALSVSLIFGIIPSRLTV
jgi:hypothetical protein